MASNTYNLNTYRAILLAKQPTITVGNTGKTFDGTVNVSFSKDEILGASTSAYFLRGDKSWSNSIIGNLYIGQYTENTAQGQDYSIQVKGGAGGIYMFVQAGSTGVVGLGKWTAANVWSYQMYWDQSNNLYIASGTVIPTTNNTGSIGTSGSKWANMYATTFNGALNGNASTASTWQNARTLTIGATGKSVNGSANVSWSMNEIMGSSDSTKFYRGDKTWSNTLTGPLKFTGSGVAITFDATNSTVPTANTPTALSYTRLQSYAPLYINADTDGSQTEYCLITSGHGMSTSNADGLAIGYNSLTWKNIAVVYNSGTWGISITGSAGSVAWANVSGRPTIDKTTVVYQIGRGADVDPIQSGYFACMTTKSGITGNWWHLLSMDWSGNDANNWISQIAIPTEGRNGIYYRSRYSSTTSAWVKCLDADNYTSYTVTKTGSGASGTWGISITGNAATATNVAWSGVTGKPTQWDASAATTLSAGLPTSRNTGHTYLCGNGVFISGPATSNDCGWLRATQTSESDFVLEIATGDDGGAGESIVCRQYNTSNAVAHEITLMDHSGYSTFIRAYNAVWNDIAEYRKCNIHEPGYAIAPSGRHTSHRLESGARITSDTYGFALGGAGAEETEQMPVAIAGRVLAYPLHDKSYYQVGDAVCAAEGGKIDKMSREEIMMYPDRILGIVNEIPDYDIWEPSTQEGGHEPIHTNGRIWIDVR